MFMSIEILKDLREESTWTMMTPDEEMDPDNIYPKHTIVCTIPRFRSYPSEAKPLQILCILSASVPSIDDSWFSID